MQRFAKLMDHARGSIPSNIRGMDPDYPLQRPSPTRVPFPFCVISLFAPAFAAAFLFISITEIFGRLSVQVLRGKKGTLSWDSCSS